MVVFLVDVGIPLVGRVIPGVLLKVVFRDVVLVVGSALVREVALAELVEEESVTGVGRVIL